MIILDGRKVRDFYREKLIERICKLSFVPKLALIQVGDAKESSVYIEQKKKFALSLGVEVEHLRFPETISFDDLSLRIKEENEKADVHGIIVQLPLPAHLDKEEVIGLIDPKKDVDGLTDESQRLLSEGSPRFIPATAKAIARILDFYGISVRGKKVAVLGRSKLVGSPTAKLFSLKGGEVEVCHSKTENTREVARSSDIVVVAIGRPGLIGEGYIRQGATVIDVGITSVGGKLKGDVDQGAVSGLVEAVTPVPGGVGPVTVLCLFDNLIEAAETAARHVA